MELPHEIGNWIKISVLGSGAFGTVTLWHNRENSDFIAIKKCKFQRPAMLSAKQKERWHMEVDFLKKIDHPNIISYKRMDQVLAETINKYNPTKLPLLPMEYCRKGNLRRYLSSEPIRLCGLPEYDVRYILEDISNGLKYLHSKKITHRDIKPDNIVLQHCDNRRGETIYKIIDLGYAKELQDSTLSFVGTLHYLAPEIFYNQDYGHSVDFWSMGTMVFESICGILPFLPELTPFERFEKIKDKGPEDICIYMSYSGSITNTTEIKKENFITSCFKLKIETWLKRVLQMNPTDRTFKNELTAFDYLRYILDKKIIQVFSVYKQEFYSYEINDSTLFGTLKEWISRDIKVAKTDLLFLFRSQKRNPDQIEGKEKIWHCKDDNTLLEYLVTDDDVVLYVYKKDALFCDKSCKVKLPSLLEKLFNPNSQFQLKFAKNLYRQALFYVFTALRDKEELKSAYLSITQYALDIGETIKNKFATAKSDFAQLISKLNLFLQRKKDGKMNLNNNLSFSDYPEIENILKYFERLLSSLERREANLKDFAKQCKLLEKNILEINNAREKVQIIFKNCDVRSQFDILNGKGFLEKTKNGESGEETLIRIRSVISQTLKLKYNLSQKENYLKVFSVDIWIILKWTEELVSWVDDFIIKTNTLSTDLDAMQKRHDAVILEAVKTKKPNFNISINLEDAKEVIKENKLLRCEFLDLLSQKVAIHKDFVDQSGNYFD